MRASEKEQKRRRRALPDLRKKIDTSVVEDATPLIEWQKEIEKKLYPLRIDHGTVIYVTKDKCTPEYAEMKRRKMSRISRQY